MERRSKKCWTIVAPTVRTKVARLWWNREEAAAYLRELYDRTLTKRQELQQAVAKVPDSKKWGDTRTAADVDLARVYVVAIQCLECTTHFDTYKEFEQAMNQATVRQLASPAGWGPALGNAGPVPGSRSGLTASRRHQGLSTDLGP